MTNNDRNEIKIAVGYLKLLASMNGIDVNGPKSRFWSEKYQVTARHSDFNEHQKQALITNIRKLEEMIERS